MGVFLLVCQCAVYVQFLRKPEEGVRSQRVYPAGRVRDDCELPGGCWESDLCPREAQAGLLTVELAAVQPFKIERQSRAGWGLTEKKKELGL